MSLYCNTILLFTQCTILNTAYICQRLCRAREDIVRALPTSVEGHGEFRTQGAQQQLEEDPWTGRVYASICAGAERSRSRATAVRRGADARCVLLDST